MTDAEQTNDILTGHGDAATVVNTDGVARADHAEVTEDGRVFLSASDDPSLNCGQTEASPSYDELRQACGELEGEVANRDETIATQRNNVALVMAAIQDALDGIPLPPDTISIALAVERVVASYKYAVEACNEVRKDECVNRPLRNTFAMCARVVENAKANKVKP